jgi:cell division protein FtsI/penicillin-binding protein 2
VEHDSNRKLQGYEYPELAALVRYRHQPGNQGIARILARDRNVHLTVDIRLQMRAREILDQHLAKAPACRTVRWWCSIRGDRRRAGAGERARARSARLPHA